MMQCFIVFHDRTRASLVGDGGGVEALIGESLAGEAGGVEALGGDSPAGEDTERSDSGPF